MLVHLVLSVNETQPEHSVSTRFYFLYIFKKIVSMNKPSRGALEGRAGDESEDGTFLNLSVSVHRPGSEEDDEGWRWWSRLFSSTYRLFLPSADRNTTPRYLGLEGGQRSKQQQQQNNDNVVKRDWSVYSGCRINTHMHTHTFTYRTIRASSWPECMFLDYGRKL